MKKSKLSLCMVSCLLAAGTLAGCDKKIRSANDGVLMSYYVNGEKREIKADEILNDYYDDSSKYQSIYDTIYNVIVRNYFTEERGKVSYFGEDRYLGKTQMDETIYPGVEEKVNNDIETAKKNAKTNNTRFKKEWEAILESKGVEDENELREKYTQELQKETFEDNFYTYCVEEMKNANNGSPIEVKMIDDMKFQWNGYFKDQLPYHVSHVMVELADTSDTNYHNGTISKENAERLFNVVSDLADENKSFANVAYSYSDDTASAQKQGDLGIMDYSTSFINEFKLGVYAYEQFYKGTTVDSKIQIKSAYESEVTKTFGSAVPTVKLKVFKDLFDAAKVESDGDKKQVLEGSTLLFPRNVIYNKYLNIHEVFFIEDDTTSLVNKENFKEVTIGGSPKTVLCAKLATGEYAPVLCVRGSSQDKQEIHFIVVNRSPYLATDANGVSLSNYYTTYYPLQSKQYPKDANKKDMKTYVNFLNTEDAQSAENKTRAEEVASKIKSYDSEKLGKYIFLKYMNEEKITFGNNNKLAKALMKWINTSVEQKAETATETWNKTVNDYVDKLARQNSERSKLIPVEANLVYSVANADQNLTYILAHSAEYNGFALTPDQITALKAAIKASGCADKNKDGTTEDGEVDDYYDLPVQDWYKKEGGFCNDGKAHL